jgi:hypothetical protein
LSPVLCKTIWWVFSGHSGSIPDVKMWQTLVVWQWCSSDMPLYASHKAQFNPKKKHLVMWKQE